MSNGRSKSRVCVAGPGREGVGTSLLNALERSANAAGIERLRLDASLNSVGFYERMWYQTERPGVHRTLGGQEIRCVHMRKELAL